MKWGIILLLSLMTCVSASAAISSDIELDLGINVGEEYHYTRNGEILSSHLENGTVKWNSGTLYPLKHTYEITEITETKVSVEIVIEQESSVTHDEIRYDMLGNLITSVIWDYWYDALESDEIDLVFPIPLRALYFEYAYAMSNTSFSFGYEYAIEDEKDVIVFSNNVVYDINTGVALTLEENTSYFYDGVFQNYQYFILQRLHNETGFKINAPGILALLAFPILVILRKRKN